MIKWDMHKNKFVGTALVLSLTVPALLAAEEGSAMLHVPVYTMQGFATPSASGNNTTVTTRDGWAIQTSEEAGFGYGHFLQPPYAGNVSIPGKVAL